MELEHDHLVAPSYPFLVAGFSVVLVFVLICSPYQSLANENKPAERATLEKLLALSLEELIEVQITSVGFFDTVARKAPGYSFVITADQIEKSTSRSLRDVIEMRVPGMTTGGHERHGPLIGTRGIFIDNNAKTMVMLDEQQINQRAHFGYTAGLLSPLLGDIKQVEVILGPGAIVHGSGAINGFINLISKNGKDNPGLFLNSEYGFTDEFWKVEAGYGTSYGTNKDIYLYGGVYGAEGFEPAELFDSAQRFAIHAFGFEEHNYRVSVYWNHENFNLSSFFYENNPYKNSSAEIGHFHQNTLGFRPKYVFTINETDSFEVIGSLLWFDHRSPRDLPPEEVIQDRGGAEKHWEIKNIYKTNRWDRHSLAVGFSCGKKEFFERRQFFSDDADTAIGILDTKWQEVGLFGEDVIAIGDAWTFSLGLRYDKIHLNEMQSEIWGGSKEPAAIRGHYSPRLAAAYEWDENTAIKASYQHGFRTPDAFYYALNLQYRDTAEALGFTTTVPALGIETMDSFELNLQKNLPKQKLKLDVNLFYNIFEDQLSFKFYDDLGLFTPAELAAMKAYLGFPAFVRLGSFVNAPEEIKSYGGELNATFQPGSHTQIRVSYGYVQLIDADVMQYPVHQVKLNTLTYFLGDKCSLALDYLYNSSYRGTDLPNAHDVYRKDRHVVDVALNYNINPKATIGVIVNNLFLNDVPPMVFTPESPERGGLGFDERRIYLALRLQL